MPAAAVTTLNRLSYDVNTVDFAGARLCAGKLPNCDREGKTASMREIMHAAIYRDHRAGDISRERGTKKRRQLGHIFRFAEVANRDMLRNERPARFIASV